MHHLCRVQARVLERRCSCLTSEAKQGRVWLVLGWEKRVKNLLPIDKQKSIYIFWAILGIGRELSFWWGLRFVLLVTLEPVR